MWIYLLSLPFTVSFCFLGPLRRYLHPSIHHIHTLLRGEGWLRNDGKAFPDSVVLPFHFSLRCLSLSSLCVFVGDSSSLVILGYYVMRFIVASLGKIVSADLNPEIGCTPNDSPRWILTWQRNFHDTELNEKVFRWWMPPVCVNI